VTAILLVAGPTLARPGDPSPTFGPVPELGLRAAATGPVGGVSFVPPADGSVLVHGTYPSEESACIDPEEPVLHTRVPGTIEVGRDTDGSLFVIAELPFERYVEGIGEVPRLWPMAALKAQVVAARTYAANRMGAVDPERSRLGYDICSTTSCQVYRGMAVAAGPYGHRWGEAVAATAGQVLLHEGQPADALYFSTSNGRTFGNEAIFGGPPVPYLRPVAERDDGASPLSHWEVRLPLRDLARFLRSAGHWSGGQVTSVSRDGSVVVVSGGGSAERMDVLDFRSHLNYWAPCLEPDRYPGVNETNGLSVPQTVPSRWFGTRIEDETVVLGGRGWGHGVGMVQWGAYGKAKRGVPYGDILASYYGGLRPVERSMPGVIRVAVATGLSSVRIAGTEGVTVAGRSVGPGPWLVTGGTEVTVRTAGPPPVYISAGSLDGSPRQAHPAATISATAEIPQLSVAHLVVRMGGRDVPLGEPITVEAGSVRLEGTVPDLPAGAYELEAVVTDGTDIVRTAPRTLRIIGPAAAPSTRGDLRIRPPEPVPRVDAPSPAVRPSGSRPAAPGFEEPIALPPGSDGKGSGGVLWLIAVLGGLIIVGALAREAVKERSGHRGGPSSPETPSGDGPSTGW
jgi:SpoIID/LytB domain protein